MGLWYFGLRQAGLLVVPVAVVVIVMAVAMIAVVAFAVPVAVVVVVLVLAVVVSVIVPDLAVVLISVPLMFPAAVPAPVGTVAALREWAAVSVMRIEVMVDVATKAHWAAEPRAGAIEHATGEPLRTVVAEGRALIGGVVEIAIGAHRRDSNADADLCGCTRIGVCQTDESKNRHSKKPGKPHNFLLV